MYVINVPNMMIHVLRSLGHNPGHKDQGCAHVIITLGVTNNNENNCLSTTSTSLASSYLRE